jgi:hypothetical protein
LNCLRSYLSNYLHLYSQMFMTESFLSMELCKNQWMFMNIQVPSGFVGLIFWKGIFLIHHGFIVMENHRFFPSLHRGAFCQFPFRWAQYRHSLSIRNTIKRNDPSFSSILRKDDPLNVKCDSIRNKCLSHTL